MIAERTERRLARSLGEAAGSVERQLGISLRRLPALRFHSSEESYRRLTSETLPGIRERFCELDVSQLVAVAQHQALAATPSGIASWDAELGTIWIDDRRSEWTRANLVHGLLIHVLVHVADDQEYGSTARATEPWRTSWCWNASSHAMPDSCSKRSSRTMHAFGRSRSLPSTARTKLECSPTSTAGSSW